MVFKERHVGFSPLSLCCPPASGPAGSGVVEVAGVTCQTDWSDVVCETDRATEFH